MASEQWDVIVERISGERERSILRAAVQRGNPHLNVSEVEALLTTPITVGSAMSADAANALMRQPEENGIPTKKRRVAKETVEPTHTEASSSRADPDGGESPVGIANEKKQQLIQWLIDSDHKYSKPFIQGKMALISVFGGNWNEYAAVVPDLVIADTLLSTDRKLSELLNQKVP